MCCECCGRCNFGLCLSCGIHENVQNFMLFCALYAKQREKYLHTVQAILINKYHIDGYSLRNLLFPPPNVTMQHRKAILQSVARYAISTRRLIRDY